MDAARRADRVLLVDQGHVVADGEPRTVVEQYRALMAVP